MTPEHPIILCGFTSSGKTTIGKLLSEQLGLPFYDTDQMLIEHYKMTIPEIFSEGGESLFRDYEHEIARQVCGLGPSVVSTGGGMLTFDRNGELLEKSGMIFYIERPFEEFPVPVKGQHSASGGHGCGPWTADVFFMLDSRLVIEI